MSISKKITEKIGDGLGTFFDSASAIIEHAPSQDEVAVLHELCAHLRQLGINATVLDWESAETKEYRSERAVITGLVKVEDRNIDLIEVEVQTNPRSYSYTYWIRVNVEVLKTKEVKGPYRLEGLAWFMPIEERKGLFSKKVVGYRWEGGELAQLLSADSDLTNTLMNEHRSVWVHLNETLQSANITPFLMDERLGKEIKHFPTPEAFEAYDRIASHIRSITDARS